MEKLRSFFNKYSEKASRHPKIWIVFYVLISAFLIYWYPPVQVSHFEINNATIEATLENQFRVTLTQILGGGAVVIGIYFAWKNVKVAQDTLEYNQKNAQDNLKVSQDGQITERFTRAIDQLGNRKMEIRLGGIYALERIANESEKDYWSIMEILTAYVRNNSGIDSYSKDISLKNVPISTDIQVNESTKNKAAKIRTISLDIQAILTVIVRRKYSYKHGETKKLNFQGTNLQQTILSEANLSWADLSGAHLSGANLSGAILSEANLSRANLSWADLSRAILSRANLSGAILSRAILSGANLSGAHLSRANLSGAHLYLAILSEANLSWADLSRAILSGAILSRAILSGADLSGAHLSGANLSGANLSRANLSGAHLSGTNLSGAILSEANLSRANLSGADLSEANLSGAILSRAHLSRANLSRADLSGAENLTIDQLSKVKTLYNAKLDEDLLVPLKEKYPALFEEPKL